MSPETGTGRMPRQIPYIIGNEACERFSFYGMRNILVPFLISSVLMQYIPEGPGRESAAKDVFHMFVIGVYFFPLLGGWLSDRYFGKYNTVLWFSLIYCAGHACLALFENNATGFYTGLFLIALGSGGIKPLVVSFCGDQFDQSNKDKAKLVFDAFYWIINFGSFFASLFAPLLLRSYGPAVAFGVPGVLMFIATVIFWLGRKQYVNVPPSGDDPDSFLRVARSALTARAAGQGQSGSLLNGIGAALAAFLLVFGSLSQFGITPAWWPERLNIVLSVCVGLGALIAFGGKDRRGFLLACIGAALAAFLVVFGTLSLFKIAPGWWPKDFNFVVSACLGLGALIAFGGIGTSLQLERARGLHPDAAIDSVRGVLRVLIVFALVTPFWSLFDQKASTWIIQGREMLIPHGEWWWPSWLIKDAAQMQALNPLLVMLLIPFNNLVLYPALRNLGVQVTALRRMGFGIAISGVSWIVAGVLQLWIDSGHEVSLAWQTLPYLLLTFGEVLVSATALEFAYSQATQAMKGVIMAFWYLTSTFGSLWVLLTNAAVRDEAVISYIASTGLSENAFLMFFFAGFAFVAAAAFGAYAKRYPVQDNYRVA